MTELAMIAANPSSLDKAADPAAFVIAACERAKAWLVEVLNHGDIDAIVELKSQAEAIRVYTLSKQLGMDAELSAAEIVRRAERGIGLAIRKGQSEGSIPHRGRPTKKKAPNESIKTVDEYLHGNRERAETYAMTDGVTDEEFDLALKAAREEQNLSRANVIRKVTEDDGFGRIAGTTPRPRPGVVDKRKKRPITDVARDLGWALRKDVERIERLIADDRVPANKDKVAAHLHSHLTYAIQALQEALARINPQGE